MRKGLLVFAPVTLFTAIVVACGAGEKRSGFGEGAGSDGGGTDGSQAFTPGQTPCVGLECKVVTDCPGATTTLHGKVYDPAGSNPLYNVQVYIPGGNTPEELPPIKDSTVEPDGIACETCASVVLSPLRSALTDGTGEFILENVPVENDVPVVIQVGKWRRMFKFDITKKCAENKVPDKTFKLPKNGDEGNMPQIAVTGGEYDALECLLRDVGIADSEFVQGHDEGGHVHVFRGHFDTPNKGMGPPAQDFWTDAAQLRKYDMLLLSCEGNEHNENKGDKQAVYDYLNAGGKAFATHYHYTWLKNSPQDEFKNLASWGANLSFATDFDVNTHFPKGEKFAEWLKETGASSTLGKIKLVGATDSVKSLNEPSLAWIKAPNNGAKYFSVNTPIGAPAEEQCGRAVFSDVHITDKAGPTSISACGISSGGLNAQQKALEFLFFDLSACVTDDKVEPQPPK